MSSEVAIQARGLGKAYAIFNKPEDRLKQMLVRGRRMYYREFWALKGVDVDIYRGETVGIVGRNGSGKSTFLHLVCGTLSPTCGELTVNGRIAALLELGAGFNPEFTGRENIFMNAAILGLEREEIERRFDAIAAFADVGDFLEQPVRTYSSGMYARVAFAVAISVDPDILVVDEALAVGDEAFQRKCFARIQEIREAGATVLFVSHSAGSVVELCDRAILLDQGKRLLTGSPKQVISKYQKLAYAPADQVAAIREEIRYADGTPEATFDDEAYSSGGIEYTAPRAVTSIAVAQYDPNLIPQSTEEYVPRGAHISDVRIEDPKGNRVNILIPGHEYTYCYKVTFDQPAFKIRFGMLIKTISGIEIAGSVSHAEGEGMDYIEAGQVVQVRFRFQNLFSPQTYFMNAGVLGWVDGQEAFLHRILDAIMFRIDPFPANRATGYVDLAVQPSCRVSRANRAAIISADSGAG